MKRYLLFLILFAGCLRLNAQTNDPQWGLLPYQTYSGSDFDQVNVRNGILHFAIPLWSYPQRGGRLTSSMKLQYNSQYYSVMSLCDPADPSDCNQLIGHATLSFTEFNHYTYAHFRSIQSAGFRFVPNDSAGVVNVGYYYLSTGSYGIEGTPTDRAPFMDYELVTADGGAHPWNILAGTGSGDGLSGGLGMSLDGTGYRASPFGILDRNGNSNNTEDADGNVIGPVDANYNTMGDVATMGDVDTMGRALYNFTSSTDTSGCLGALPISSVTTVAAPGANGSTLTYKFCYASVPIYIDGSTCGAGNVINTTSSLLQSILLPNGQSWVFEYNAHGTSDPPSTNYGEVTKITMPTGGWISYTYDTTGCLTNVISRTVNDGVASHTWTYQVAYGGPYDPDGTGVSTVTDPDGNTTVTNVNDHGYETTSQVFSAGSNTLLKRTDTTYLPEVGPITPDEASGNYVNELPQTVTTTLDNGLVSKKVYTYCCDYSFTGFGIGTDGAGNEHGGVGTWTASYGIKSGEEDYDYGVGAPGPLIRSTQTIFLWQSNQAYLNSNLLDTPTLVTVTAGGSVPVSQTAYTYDEPSSVNLTSGMTSNQQLSTPLVPGVLGHVTTTTHMVATGTGPTTHATYYDTGEVASQTDANGSTATFQYGATYWGGLLTATTNPLGQSSHFIYDLNTGKMTSSTDPNSQTTTTTLDNLGRATQIQGPLDPIQNAYPTTTICYDDVAGTCLSDSSVNAILVTKKATPDPDVVIEHRFDALGRDVGTRLLSDPAGAVYTLKTYDNLSRPYQSWNPSRCVLSPSVTSCTGETTFGITTLNYDGLGRKVTQTNPDSTSVGWAYTGNATTTTDERGVAIEHIEDALERLTQVVETNPATGSLGLNTNYQYDGNSNLLSVVQTGASGEVPRTRSFAYDWLSRLITSTNPETGTICYGNLYEHIVRDPIDPGPPPVLGPPHLVTSCSPNYDANGNLLSKTDANGMVTSYTYDALNRLVTKNAPDGGSTSFLYTYDECFTGFACGNPIGRLTGEWNAGKAGTVFAYDPMGRVTNTYWWRYEYPGWYGGMGVNYDLAGNADWMGYPDGRTITQNFDGAGRLTTVTDSTTNPALTGGGTAYFSSAQYTAAGALTSATYANGITTENITYNSRMQPCHTSANSTALAPVTGHGNVYDRTSSYASSIFSSSPCNPEPGNNGNIASIADYVHPLWTQSFGYDCLNRLTSASRSDNAYNHTYNYDSFGNLIVQDNLLGPQYYSVDPATNQLLHNVIAGGSVLDSYGHPANINEYDYVGNLVSTGPYGHTFTYNASSQITSVDGGTTASYLYNGVGERTNKTTASGWTAYIYLNGQPMSENAIISGTGTWMDYIYAGGQKIARVTNSIYGGTSVANYYLNDHLGTTQVELDAAGNVTWQGQFTPFGVELPDGSTPMHYKLTGKERDAETGLDDFGARYYASANGRWMSPDWADKPEAVPYSSLANPQSLNLYNYVGNNPLSNTDPTGHYVITCSGGDKACFKSAGKFEKQRQKDLQSKDSNVRAGATSWGDQGVDNGVSVTFKRQAQVDADAGNTDPTQRVDGFVTPGVTADHKPKITAEFSESLGGSDLGQTIAHEGTHIGDDLNFINSYDPTTGKYNEAFNMSHGDAEFRAFEAGAGVKPYTMFDRGPKGYQKLLNYIYNGPYKGVANDPLFPSTFPTAYPQ